MHANFTCACMQAANFFKKKLANSDILQGIFLQNFHATWKTSQNFDAPLKIFQNNLDAKY